MSLGTIKDAMVASVAECVCGIRRVTEKYVRICPGPLVDFFKNHKNMSCIFFVMTNIFSSKKQNKILRKVFSIILKTRNFPENKSNIVENIFSNEKSISFK